MSSEFERTDRTTLRSQDATPLAPAGRNTPFSTRTLDTRASTMRAIRSLMVLDPQMAMGELLAGTLAVRFPELSTSHARTIEQALLQLTKEPNSLVLASLRLPDGGVTELGRAMSTAFPGSLLAVWSRRCSPHLDGHFAAIPVVQFIPRSLSVAALQQQIDDLLTGRQAPVSFHTAAGAASDEGDAHSEAETSGYLSARQIDLLVKIASGMSVKEAAAQSKRSVKAVDSLKFRVMRMLDLHDRVDLARFAIREGLIDP